MAGLDDFGGLLLGREVWCSLGGAILPFMSSWLDSELLKSTLEVFLPFLGSVLPSFLELVLGGGDGLALARKPFLPFWSPELCLLDALPLSVAVSWLSENLSHNSSAAAALVLLSSSLSSPFALAVGSCGVSRSAAFSASWCATTMPLHKHIPLMRQVVSLIPLFSPNLSAYVIFGGDVPGSALGWSLRCVVTIRNTFWWIPVL